MKIISELLLRPIDIIFLKVFLLKHPFFVLLGCHYRAQILI
jgi:hypothetical protein